MTLNKRRRDQYIRPVTEEFPATYELIGRDVTGKEVSRIVFDKGFGMRYGQNPGSPAAFYQERGASGPNMAGLNVLQPGKGLGYINTGDLDLGQSVVKSLRDTHPGRDVFCVVKHEMPSAVAIGADLHQAFQRAWWSDPLSSFGGVHVFSGEVDESIAHDLVDKRKNVEVVYAPAFSPAALATLASRETLRVIQMPSVDVPAIDCGLDFKRVRGGLLVENRFQTRILGRENLDCISTAQPTDQDYNDAVFLWHIAALTRSNAVLIGTDYKTHGIGSGQRSRIDAAVNAIEFANGKNGRDHFYGSKGTFMASDAFMPAPDVVIEAAKAGIRGIVYPLGSIRDQEVIDAANERGLVLLITRNPGSTEEGGERCFMHR